MPLEKQQFLWTETSWDKNRGWCSERATTSRLWKWSCTFNKKKKKVIPCTVYSLALLSSTITIRFSDLKKSLTFECHFSSEPKLLHFKLLSQFLRGFLCFGFWVGKGISLLANSKTTLYCCLLMKGLAVLGLDVKSLNLKSLAANYYQHVGFYLKWAKKTTNKFSL